jgi:predicted short-subunit dehydrogenase-like oxidoreductase (DUF2520 family)
MTRLVMSGSCGLISPRAMLRVPGIHYGTGARTVFESACVVGAGRVGKAVAARLGESVPTRATTRELDIGDADLVVLCVPDGKIRDVAESIAPGPWIAHTSGSASVEELRGHDRRFALHPLQTFTRDGGAAQLDGTWAAISGEGPEALEAARELARLLGLEAFELADDFRPLYHAAAMMASTFVVTLHDVAGELMAAAGGPPEALLPLTRRTVENGFQHTGPLVRGDTQTVKRDGDAVMALDEEHIVLFAALVKTEARLLDEALR